MKSQIELLILDSEIEFEKFRITQDHLFESDFDKEIRQLNEGGKGE